MPERILNIVLRGATLASRFLFIFFLAKFLDPATVGLYGLFAATVGYALLLVGLDFYTFTTRELVGAKKERWGGALKSQLALSSALHILFAPVVVAFFFSGALPFNLIYWFAPILILEHLNQELFRLLIAASKPLDANSLLFVRQGAWAVAIVVAMACVPSWRSLHHMFAAWSLSGLIAAGWGLTQLKRLGVAGWTDPIDRGWIKRGVKASAGLLVATLALRGIQTIDRYWLETLASVDVVGAYVLFIGIAGVLLSFLDAGIFSYSYPRLIEAWQVGRLQDYRQVMRKMFTATLGGTVFFAIASSLTLPYLLSWIGHPFYMKHQALYKWLLLAMSLQALSMVPHYGLYAAGEDRTIIGSHLVGALAFIVVAWLTSAVDAVNAVPAGLCAAFAAILLWKATGYLGLSREHLT